MTLSLAFVVPYGEPSDGFFPDTLLAELCALARRDGHRAQVVRVYYDGRDAERDREIGRRLTAWLAARGAELVVLERLFDPEPIVAHRRAQPTARTVLITRGDSFDPTPGVDYVIGAQPGLTRGGSTRRSPTVPELRLAFQRLLAALSAGAEPATVPGVAALVEGEVRLGAPLEPAVARQPYEAVLEQDVIALGEPPRVRRKTLFGNAGCPYAADPLESAHYQGLTLPARLPLARRGCAFCFMGGDYQKRPDAEVVASLVEQATFWAQLPELEEVVLSDQHPLRYLAALLRAAAAAGLRPLRWLFAARVDAFVHERQRVREAIAAAEETGHVIETYLSGFEAFSDVELQRYHKGTTVADQLAAIDAMRELAEQHPRAFAYSRARGHSLILWNPWTRPEDLRESAERLRAAGARGLFHELGRNRLRLYRDLPIYYAAERDGALTPTWQGADEGAARRKGYSVEQPWRFLDERTRVAHELAARLRDELGVETELSQLHAITAFVARGVTDAEAAQALAGVRALAAALDALAHQGRAARAVRASTVTAEPVGFTGACNNACPGCANRDSWLTDTREGVLARVAQARACGRAVALAGREPTLHPAFLEAVRAARGQDERLVGVVSNGRRFAYRPFTEAAWQAGLRAASIKLFGVSAAEADAITRDAGGHAQTVRGLGELRRAGLEALELRVPLHRAQLPRLQAFAGLAATLEIRQLRVECALDALGLEHALEAAHAVERLAEAAERAGVALDAAPLPAGSLTFDKLPARR